MDRVQSGRLVGLAREDRIQAEGASALCERPGLLGTVGVAIAVVVSAATLTAG